MYIWVCVLFPIRRLHEAPWSTASPEGSHNAELPARHCDAHTPRRCGSELSVWAITPTGRPSLAFLHVEEPVPQTGTSASESNSKEAQQSGILSALRDRVCRHMGEKRVTVPHLPPASSSNVFLQRVWPWKPEEKEYSKGPQRCHHTLYLAG